ncbi:MAG TPA: hypothetical protein VMT47_00520, partial [Polyangia bacterium]|nr:hypothetical protein [Polyangia bacterium]
MTLGSLRGSALAVSMAVAAWSAGCATAPPPLVDPAFATGAYVPARIAVLPPDVFVVVDQVGDNDPARSAALGQAVSGETVRVVEQALRARGYDVDLSARWDGIVAGDGSVLVNRDELRWLVNGVLQFGNSGAGVGPPAGPGYVAPELAAKVGWATQSDALLYVNVKGVTTTSGKRAASILAGVFIVVIVAAIVLALVANGKGGGSGGPSVGGGGFRGQSVARAPSGGGFRGVPPAGGAAARMPSGGFHGAPTSGGAAAAMPSGGFHGAPAAGGAAAGMPSGSSVARPPGAFSAPSGGAATSGGWRGGGVAQGGGGGGGWRGGGGPTRAPG